MIQKFIFIVSAFLIFFISHSATIFAALTGKPEADFDGDGKADIAVYRNGIWYLWQSSQGLAIETFGTADDIPLSK